MIQKMHKAAIGLACVSVCVASCTMRPAVENTDSNTQSRTPSFQNSEMSVSQPIANPGGGFEFPKSTFPLPYSAMIATKTTFVAGAQQEINIRFTNLSNKSISLMPECWRPLEIIETSTNRIVIPVSSSFTCVMIRFPPVVLEPRATHLFRIGFWSATGVNGQSVSPGTYTIRGAVKLNYSGETEIIEAIPLTIDVRSN